MSGRCFGCASKFGLLRKELGCKNCGHAYCSSCLSHSALVPRLGGTQHKVCKLCYDSLTSGGKRDNPARWSPPENYKRRVAALEARPQQKETGAKKTDAQPPALSVGARYRGLSKEDRAIAERLEKLKEETKSKSIPSEQEIALRLASMKNDPVRPVPTTAEMQDRLAVLQGQTPPSQAPKPAPNNRTQTEQVNDLFEQLSEEVAIDYKYSPGSGVEGTAGAMNDLNKGIDPRHFNSDTDDNVERFEGERNNLMEQAEAELKQENVRQESFMAMKRRLATLKGEDPSAVTVDDWKHTGQESDEENEELAIQRVLKQVTEEANLDIVSGYNIPVEQPVPAQGQTTPPQPQPAGRKVPFAKLQAPATVPVVEAASADEEELPWCCICNSDAVLRCQGCDGDLYCQRCFREGHDKFERKEHRTSSYRPPNKKK